MAAFFLGFLISPTVMQRLAKYFQIKGILKEKKLYKFKG